MKDFCTMDFSLKIENNVGKTEEIDENREIYTIYIILKRFEYSLSNCLRESHTLADRVCTYTYIHTHMCIT
jgi:hypothetical protein